MLLGNIKYYSREIGYLYYYYIINIVVERLFEDQILDKGFKLDFKLRKVIVVVDQLISYQI